ncbi:hypothetical protein FKM82_007850 [Ascaphus truei]
MLEGPHADHLGRHLLINPFSQWLLNTVLANGQGGHEAVGAPAYQEISPHTYPTQRHSRQTAARTGSGERGGNREDITENKICLVLLFGGWKGYEEMGRIGS